MPNGNSSNPGSQLPPGSQAMVWLCSCLMAFGLVTPNLHAAEEGFSANGLGIGSDPTENQRDIERVQLVNKLTQDLAMDRGETIRDLVLEGSQAATVTQSAKGTHVRLISEFSGYPWWEASAELSIQLGQRVLTTVVGNDILVVGKTHVELFNAVPTQQGTRRLVSLGRYLLPQPDTLDLENQNLERVRFVRTQGKEGISNQGPVDLRPFVIKLTGSSANSQDLIFLSGNPNSKALARTNQKILGVESPFSAKAKFARNQIAKIYGQGNSIPFETTLGTRAIYDNLTETVAQIDGKGNLILSKNQEGIGYMKRLQLLRFLVDSTAANVNDFEIVRFDQGTLRINVTTDRGVRPVLLPLALLKKYNPKGERLNPAQELTKDQSRRLSKIIQDKTYDHVAKKRTIIDRVFVVGNKAIITHSPVPASINMHQFNPADSMVEKFEWSFEAFDLDNGKRLSLDFDGKGIKNGLSSTVSYRVDHFAGRLIISHRLQMWIYDAKTLRLQNKIEKVAVTKRNISMEGIWDLIPHPNEANTLLVKIGEGMRYEYEAPRFVKVRVDKQGREAVDNFLTKEEYEFAKKQVRTSLRSSKKYAVHETQELKTRSPFFNNQDEAPGQIKTEKIKPGENGDYRLKVETLTQTRILDFSHKWLQNIGANHLRVISVGNNFVVVQPIKKTYGVTLIGGYTNRAVRGKPIVVPLEKGKLVGNHPSYRAATESLPAQRVAAPMSKPQPKSSTGTGGGRCRIQVRN